jgi:3-oxoacyl-[acyl-carrier protein] reductase
MDLGLSGKKALVTGGSSGIGFAIAKELAAEGAHVVIASRNEANIESALGSIGKACPKASVEGLIIDLMDDNSIRNALSKSGTGFDILVTSTGGPASGAVLDLSLEDWDRGYQSLVRSLLILTQSIVPHMQDRGWGRVLNITSTSAVEVLPGLPISGTFRAGLSAWAKSLAREVGKEGVLVNNLLPGPTRTDRLKELETKNPVFFKNLVSRSALGRIAEPEEIGRIGAFLCSAANTFLTGSDVLVDGASTLSV